MIVILAFVVALAVALAMGAVVRRTAPVIGAVVPPRPDRWHREPTPTMGGVAIVVAMAIGFVVTAPRVTLSNGQRGYVVVSTQTAYVSDLEPIVGTRAVGFDPTISIIESGILLDVQGTVSADRKYVTLTLRPTLSRLAALTTFTVQSAAQVTGDDDDDTPVQSGIATATVQQPIVERTLVRTTVTVPDGGTLLLGGQTLAGEIEREAGVPVLSKIPFLKRLFTNRSTAKDEQVLPILVKPTIIIAKEQERKQFPVLSTRVGQ